MHEGRVMQCGAPEDVYERPSEEFVAGFIGISNLITGTVEDSGKVRSATDSASMRRCPTGCRTATASTFGSPGEDRVDDDVEAGW